MVGGAEVYREGDRMDSPGGTGLLLHGTDRKKLEETHSREFLRSAEFRRSGGACLWAVNPPAIWDVICEQKLCVVGLHWWSSCPRMALFPQQRAVEVLTLV